MFVFTFETIITGVLVALYILITLYFGVKKYFKQRKCKHERYRETMSCDAVCCDCSKNLGFIGTVRGDK